MSDIDFDELDRAVSSVLGVPAQQLQPAPTPAPADSVQPTQPVVAAPVVTPVAVSPTPAQPVRPSAVTPRPTTGRFMDVVHPSSDMRTATPAPQAETQPALTVEPQVTVVPEPAQPEIDAFELIQDDFVAPLESPFITDAKVEKRPLGAFSPDQTTEPIEQDQLMAPILDSTLEPSEEAFISAIEIGDTDPLTVIADEPQIVEEPIVEAEQPVYVPEPIAVQPEPEAQPPEFTPAIQSSIPQQYTEQVSTDQQPSGAIFDTESYHQPLAHPQKKKSGVLVVVWILGLIVLGAGLGVSLYFFVLKGL